MRKGKLMKSKEYFMKSGQKNLHLLKKKPMCLICNIELAHNKKGNIKRHYETKHMNFSEEYLLNLNHRKKKKN